MHVQAGDLAGPAVTRALRMSSGESFNIAVVLGSLSEGLRAPAELNGLLCILRRLLGLHLSRSKSGLLQ